MKGAQCIPRFRTAARGGSTASTPVSLLERFREVVFRLIMLSALSKAPRSSNGGRRQQGGVPPLRVYRQDSYRSEAIEDCIEFFKRSGGATMSSDDAKSSSVSDDTVSNGVTLTALPVL